MEDKRVKDLMISLGEYATVSADSTIKDALKALSKAQLGLTYDRHHHRAVLVLDDGGNVIGKLSHWAVLRTLDLKIINVEDLVSLSRESITSKFLEEMKDGLVELFGNLATVCKKASKIKAREAMVHMGESIDENAPLTFAIHHLVINHIQSMLVTRNGKVVGTLRLSDVFEEVANIIRSSDD
jgi:CBS domain-containing protein